MVEIAHYVTTEDRRDVCVDWLEKLKDMTAKIAAVRRVARMESGNFGDHKFCRDGVSELRIDTGAGYRVYYAMAGKQRCCCCVVVTNARRARTLTAPALTGSNGKRRTGNE